MSTTRTHREEIEPTRNERRARAREQRLAQQQAEGARALRRTRLRLLGGALALAVTGIVAVLIATAGGTASAPVAPQSREAKQTVAAISSLLQGIPQSGSVLGRRGAPVKLQYFGDLQCPVCRSFTVGTLPTVIHNLVRPGELQIEYRSLETATSEPEEFAAEQTAALAAGNQGRTWNFLETFYHEQQEEGTSYATDSFLQGIAGQLPGLDMARWSHDRRDPALAEKLTVDAQSAAAHSLGGTPAFLIEVAGRRGAQVLEAGSVTDPQSFQAAILAARGGAR